MQRYVSASITHDRMWDRVDTRDNDTEPLSKKEEKRLEYLIAKVEKVGTPSVLTGKELKDYNYLGKRRNTTDGLYEKVSLPTAIRPWITQ